jgi:hypothetical protein
VAGESLRDSVGPNTNKCHANVPLANKYFSDTNTMCDAMLSSSL